MANSVHEEATYLWVAERVIRKSGRPLRAGEIVDMGIDDGLFDDRELSRTPQKSMQARLSLEILNNGHESTFIRTSRGRFFLRDLASSDVTLDVSLLPGRVEGLSVYTAPRRGPPPPAESVLVVPKSAYKEILDFQGIDPNYGQILSALLPRSLYIPRTEAETTEEFKQFVTYVVIQHNEKVLSFRRGSYSRAATFLRGARCVGFGGHVTEADLSLFSLTDSGLRANAVREVDEELRLSTGYPSLDADSLEIVGVLNDDSSDVGRRHLAVVMRYWVEDWDAWRDVQRGEASVNQLRWLDLRHPVDLTEFEYWSQLTLKELFPASVSAAPSYKIRRRSVFSQPHILAVLGEIGSGKSETTRVLTSQAGYREVNSGRVLAGILGLPPVPQTPRDAFQGAAQEFISGKGGPSRLGKALAIEAGAGPRVIVDGIRQPETLQYLRDAASVPVAVLFVYTPPDIAFEFYRLREAGTVSSVAFDDFLKVTSAPVESEVRYMIREADVVSYNWLGVEAYKRSLSGLIAELHLDEV